MRIVIAFVAVLLFQTIAVDSAEAGPFCGMRGRIAARRAARHGACAGAVVVTHSACANTIPTQSPTQAPIQQPVKGDWPTAQPPAYTAP